MSEKELADAKTTIVVLRDAIRVREEMEDKLTGKMLVMRDALEAFVEYAHADEEKIGAWPVLQHMVDYALSAAPKVVWSGEGIAFISQFQPDAGTEWEQYTFVECDGATVEIQGKIVDEDGQQVTVYVTRRSDETNTS